MKNTYTIKEGKHYASGFNFGRHKFSKEVTYKFVLGPECYYQKEQLNDKTGINKVGGFGIGLNHHENSVRIGWQPDFEREDTSIKIYVYLYNNGVRYDYYISNIYTCEVHKIKFSFTELCNQLIVEVNSQPFYIPEHYFPAKDGLKLFPYFGGNSTAPHDMKIYFERLN